MAIEYELQKWDTGERKTVVAQQQVRTVCISYAPGIGGIIFKSSA